MNRFIKSLVVFAALLAVLSVSASAEGKRYEKDGFHIAVLEGTPYEMGLQQGQLFKEEINVVYDKYLKELVLDNWFKKYALLRGNQKAYKDPEKALIEFAKSNEKFVPEEYREEMRGIAEGAGVPYELVLGMSVHVDYFAVLGCSTFVATGDATTDGKLIEGRNLDWAQGGLRDLDKFSSLVVFKPAGGHSFVSVIYPGIVGVLTGFNDSKFTAELNFSMAKKNDPEGMPILVLMRQLIQYSTNVDEAEKILRDAKRIAGYNITVSDGKNNDARLIEITAASVGTMNLTNNTLISTNHFVTTELKGKNLDTSRYSEAPSPERFARLEVLLKENHGKIDPAKAIEMMQDSGVRVGGTVQTAVFKPSENLMWVWARNRADGDFVKFDVAELLGASSVSSSR